MPRVEYPRSSPYSVTPQASWRLGPFVNRPVPKRDDDRVIVVEARHSQRPDKLSFDLYGTPVYWWVFAVRNPNLLRDPIFDLKAGLSIVVPSIDNLRAAVG